ncbi:MAG TPA: SRPBCC family protein [Nitrospira sp.]|nr:SRPBCC family protein [Nitrospira sp.]HNN43300.1 SRPBCC family protein [Nitrospira sp.]
MRVMVYRWCRLGMVVASLTSTVLAPAAPMWAGEVGSIQLLRALVVQAEPTGGVRATATLLFPGNPAVLHSILTEYHKWPELFETKMRVAQVEEREGHVLTDVFISHPLLPGEQRLICDSQVLPGGGLVTDLKGGDFKQYHRTWKLEAAGDGSQTRADFELLVEPKTLIPDWLIAVAMERELNAHFHLVRQRALDRVTKER